MDSRQLKVTSKSLANGWINLRPCGRDFFPDDAFGKARRTSGLGRALKIEVVGLPEPVVTDLPTDGNGRPRWFFRDRKWLRRFARVHALEAGQDVTITRLDTDSYRIEPTIGCLTFIDLFAGIGGFRLAFQETGARCVFSCEWDKHAQKTYEANFGDRPAGDIRQIVPAEIPDHDILLAGFPCQPFSIAGVSKKNALGKAHGFLDKTQGTLFFEVAKIIKEKQPRAFVLENVKHLLRHDGGRTFEIILRTLEEDLGYQVSYKVIDALLVVPQHRERVFIVGTKPPRPFTFPTDREVMKKRRHDCVGTLLERRPADRYTLTDHLWEYLQAYAEKHKAAGNGFGFGLIGHRNTARTLSARYYKDGSEILIRQPGKNPRRLTPRECARLMGFPDSFRIEVSDTQAYRQFGNSVVVPVVHAVADKLVESLRCRQSCQSFEFSSSLLAHSAVMP